MAKISPFKALRPIKELAHEVATLPYDVCSVEEARKYANQPNNFYHITRSEIDLAEGIDVHTQEVYNKAADNLDDFISRGVLFQEDKDCYYIYRLIMNGRTQTGILCGSAISDYNNGIIKKHEYTRPEKELDRINHIKTTKAQTGVVFLAYRDVAEIDEVIENWKSLNSPDYDFVAEDDIQHTIWVVNDDTVINQITQLFENRVPVTYIADGHHRTASAAKVAQELRNTNSASCFLTCIFPANQLRILDYNRIVKTLNGYTSSEFLELLKRDFDVKLFGKDIVKPGQTKEFGMYIESNWYRLRAKEGTYEQQDPIGRLDVSILQQNVLDKILGIKDPRTDERIDFVGGIRGLEELVKRVDSGEYPAAFACYPVSIEQLFDVADSGKIMPPKSTWFEPKTRDGLIVFKL